VDSFERDAKADNYIAAHKCDPKLVDPEYDCSICLGPFESGDEIISLGCSDKHIYHIKCIENYLKGDDPVKKCALCRVPIKFDDDFFNEDQGQAKEVADEEMG
jgi:hypothetical protein